MHLHRMVRLATRARSRLAWLYALATRRRRTLIPARCAFCGPTLFARPDDDDNPHAVRCVRCGVGLVQLSLGWALRDEVGSMRTLDACELSARGPVAAFFRREARSAATSEYFSNVEPGTMHEGMRCEDVQCLTYADASFDVVAHGDVMEHVPDDARAFRELRRVLRPGGRMVFSIPMYDGEKTVERARLAGGTIEYLEPPVYHDDPLRPEGILAFRDYGRDVVDRLRAAGFSEARVLPPSPRLAWLGWHPVVYARA